MTACKGQAGTTRCPDRQQCQRHRDWCIAIREKRSHQVPAMSYPCSVKPVYFARLA
jgi:hypothetical protein